MGSRFAISVLAAALAAATLATAAVPEPQGVPPRLRPSANEVASLRLTGSGVMIYQCRATLTNPNAYAWYYVAPDATLYDGGHEVARMTSPNLIEGLSDPSSLSGVVRASQAATGGLPWTLAQAIPMGDSGIFAGVTSFQRLNTRGGMPPATGCSSDNVGEESRIAFDADYYFYRKRGS